MKRYLVQTFGCQMNVHDSQHIEALLEEQGYAPAEGPADADLVLVNTCSVREKAEHKLMSLLGRLRPLKEARPGALLAVAGCVAQQEGDRLLKKAPYVDLVLGPDNISELPRLLREAEGGAPPMVRADFDTEVPRFLMPRARGGQPRVSAFVTTMKGCDERCTYCVVPHTRGPERYRPADGIVDEVRALVDEGVREVTLLGQTVNSWYDPTKTGETDALASLRRPSEFANLLRRIDEEAPGLCRLRYTSPHPKHLNEHLIGAHRDLDVLASHLHLPVQSGSDHVLKRMLRRYTRAEYLLRIAALRRARPGLTLSTDIIVGFPGETEAEFQETLSLVQEAGFVAAFAFKYSPRPYTPALRLGDDISEEVKGDRLSRLFDVVESQQVAHLQSLVGTKDRVLVEGRSDPRGGAPGPQRASASWTGRSDRNEIVHLTAPPTRDFTGALVEVEITAANKHSLMGEIQDVLVPPFAPSAAMPGASSGRRALAVL